MMFAIAPYVIAAPFVVSVIGFVGWMIHLARKPLTTDDAIYAAIDEDIDALRAARLERLRVIEGKAQGDVENVAWAWPERQRRELKQRKRGAM